LTDGTYRRHLKGVGRTAVIYVVAEAGDKQRQHLNITTTDNNRSLLQLPYPGICRGAKMDIMLSL